VILFCAAFLCLVSFTLPPVGVAFLGILLSFVVGTALSVVTALLVWITCVPVWWSARWLAFLLVAASRN
jgi:hypothetical protein